MIKNMRRIVMEREAQKYIVRWQRLNERGGFATVVDSETRSFDRLEDAVKYADELEKEDNETA